MRLVSWLFLLSVLAVSYAEEKTTDVVPPGNGVPPGTKSEHELMEGKIEHVFEYVDGDYHYLAYQVTYKGSAIIVPVMFPKKTLKVGDDVKYMALKVELPQEGKAAVHQIQFMSFDYLTEVAPAP